MDELDELRLKIAKLKGYTFWDSLDKLGPWTRKGNPVAAFYAGGIPLYKVENPVNPTWSDDDPDWPRDIAAAWELVEEIRQSGFSISIDGHIEAGFDVILYAPHFGDQVFAITCATAPEAISRAYRAWREAVQQEAQ
jgi:hypothetical protein